MCGSVALQLPKFDLVMNLVVLEDKVEEAVPGLVARGRGSSPCASS